jgi:hypothetical protein
MEKDRLINLQKYTSPKSSKRLMIRIVLYAVFLFIIGAFFIRKLSQNKAAAVPVKQQIREIHGVKIELK